MLEIKLNDSLVAIAGGDGINSISAHIDALIDHTGNQHSCQTSINGSTISLKGGLNSFITWFESNLSVGDKIEISIIDSYDKNHSTKPIKILKASQ